jgi:DNA-binding HxlR family transcriptional regulator
LALSLLAVPLNLTILESLARAPKALDGLRRSCGASVPTIRRHLRTLARAAAVERRGGDSPHVAFGLTAAGRDLLRVATAVRGWLASAPAGELQLGDAAAHRTIKALVDGWSAGILRLLAARPLSLDELERIGRSAGLPERDDRLGPMLKAGLVEAVPGPGRPCRYTPSPWLRRAIGPLAVAARWERRRDFGVARPIGRLDVESAFLLTTPLVRLPGRLSGSCRVTVDIGDADSGRQHASAMIVVERGAVASCVAPSHGRAQSWVSGSAARWLDAVIDGESEGLQLGGDERLASALLDGLHAALFRRGQAIPS